jgi:hypothetical protein
MNLHLHFLFLQNSFTIVHPCKPIPSDLFPYGFPAETWFALLISPMHTTYPAHLIHLDLRWPIVIIRSIIMRLGHCEGKRSRCILWYSPSIVFKDWVKPGNSRLSIPIGLLQCRPLWIVAPGCSQKSGDVIARSSDGKYSALSLSLWCNPMGRWL